VIEPKLTPEQYAKRVGKNCPRCLSENIDAMAADFTGCVMKYDEGTGESILQDMTCYDCDAEWTEIYKLSGYKDLREENGSGYVA